MFMDITRIKITGDFQKMEVIAGKQLRTAVADLLLKREFRVAATKRLPHS